MSVQNAIRNCIECTIYVIELSSCIQKSPGFIHLLYIACANRSPKGITLYTLSTTCGMLVWQILKIPVEYISKCLHMQYSAQKYLQNSRSNRENMNYVVKTLK